MGDQTTKSKSRVNLAEPLRSAATQGIEGAQDLYGRTDALPSAYVGMDPRRQQGLEMAQGLAQGGAQVQPAAIDQYTRAMGGEYLSPESNPYLEEMVNRSVLAAQGAVNRGTGRYGSGTWSNAMADATTGAAARLYSAAYEAERDRMTQLMGLAPQMSALEYAPSSELERVGAMYEADQGGQQAEAIRQYMFPYEQQQLYERSLAGTPLTQELQSKSKTVQPFNPLMAAAAAAPVVGSAMSGGYGGFGGGWGGGGYGTTSPGWPSTVASAPPRYLPTSPVMGAGNYRDIDPYAYVGIV